jgi:hypothetical protein
MSLRVPADDPGVYGSPRDSRLAGSGQRGHGAGMRRANSILARAFSDTRRAARGWGFGVPAILIFLLGTAVHYKIAGSAAVIAEWQIWLAYSLVPIGALALSMFLFNLVASPFRIERDQVDKLEDELENERNKRMAAESERDALKAVVSHFNLHIDATIWGGCVAGLPNAASLVTIVSIVNAGNAPSAAVHWHMWLESSGETLPLPLIHLQNFTVDLQEQGATKFSESDSIYRKTVDPLQAGGFKQGHLVSLIEQEVVERMSVGDKLFVGSRDIMDASTLQSILCERSRKGQSTFQD